MLQSIQSQVTKLHCFVVLVVVATLFFEYSVTISEANLAVVLLSVLSFLLSLRLQYSRLEWTVFSVFFIYVLFINHFVGFSPGKGLGFLLFTLFIFSSYGLLRTSEQTLFRLFLPFIYSLFLISAVVNIIGFIDIQERQYGLFLDSSSNGLYSLLGLIINFYYLEICKNKKLKAAMLFAACVFLFSIAFVQARLIVAFLVLFVMWFVYRAYRIKRICQLKQALLAGLAFSLAEWIYIYSTTRNQWSAGVEAYASVNGRIPQWRAGWQYLIEHNFIPSGFGTWKAIYPQYREEYGAFGDFGHYIHNDYLQFLITGGFLPTLILIGLFSIVLVKFLRLVISIGEIQGLAFYPLILILIIHGFVVLNFLFDRLDVVFFYCGFWVWYISYGAGNKIRSAFQLSGFLKISLLSVTLVITPYLLSNHYYIYRVEQCSKQLKESFLCSDKILPVFEVVAPDDLAKHMVYVDVIDKMVSNPENEFNAYSAIVAYESAYYFINRAIDKGYATPDHYAYLAYASFYYSQWGLGVVDDQYISDLVDNALALDPGFATAHLVRAMMLNKSEGPKVAGIYLVDFMNSPWFHLIKGRPQGNSILKAINGFNQLAGEAL